MPTDPNRRPRRRTGGPGRLPAPAAAQLPDRLLDAALVVFMRDGFARATMAAIASAAGTTRKTLYARHANKTEVLAAVVGRLLDAALAPARARSGAPAASMTAATTPSTRSASLSDSLPASLSASVSASRAAAGSTRAARARSVSAREPRATLLATATELATLSVSPEVVGLNRLILAEAAHTPVLADLFLDLHARAVAAVQARLAALQRAGHLRRPRGDPRVAASLFVEMSCSLPRLRALLGRPMAPDELRAHVRAAVTQFPEGLAMD